VRVLAPFQQNEDDLITLAKLFEIGYNESSEMKRRCPFFSIRTVAPEYFD
jgi:hypothetical protein